MRVAVQRRLNQFCKMWFSVRSWIAS